MRIQHNISALNAHRNLGTNNSATAKSLEKLSSGYRINRAGDDAAGLAISEKMRGQINGLEQAQNNAQDGISLIQTAEGALNETHSILQRMRTLAVQSSNGTYQNEVDRDNLNKEVTALKSEIDRIAKSTHFNKIQLLDGTMGKAYTETAASTAAAEKMESIEVSGGNITGTSIAAFSISVDATGAATVTGIMYNKGGSAATLNGTFEATTNNGLTILTYKAGDNSTKEEIEQYEGVTITVQAKKDPSDSSKYVATSTKFSLTGDTSTSGVTFQIGANGVKDQQVTLSVGDMSSKGVGVDGVSVSTQDNANTAIDTIDKAINKVSSTRADLGALQNRLEHTINNLGVTSENLTAAESRVRDVDMAKEMMSFTKNNILAQAAQAMLAQANTQPQGVLQLLQ